VIGLLILYLKTIASPQNGLWFIKKKQKKNFILNFLESATLVLSFGPFISFVLTLILMVTTLILLGACKLFEKNRNPSI
jgi:hypothetical protein